MAKIQEAQANVFSFLTSVLTNKPKYITPLALKLSGEVIDSKEVITLNLNSNGKNLIIIRYISLTPQLLQETSKRSFLKLIVRYLQSTLILMDHWMNLLWRVSFLLTKKIQNMKIRISSYPKNIQLRTLSEWKLNRMTIEVEANLK